MTSKQDTDFAAVSRAALRYVVPVLRRVLPEGRREGAEYVSRNPTRPDRRLGSFKVNTRTGRWCDFATGDKGGDLVSLVAYLEGCSQIEAARLLGRIVGMEIER